VWSLAAREMVPAAVYDGTVLGAGAVLAGPAVVELMNTTIIVLEGFDLIVDRFGSFILYAGARGRELAEELAPDLTELTS
jgi:N-methylhydantoinase A/oxoprolinase/acetone carboxylase beta subunit